MDAFEQIIERQKYYSFYNDKEFMKNNEGSTYLRFFIYFYLTDECFKDNNQSIYIYKLLPKNWVLRDIIISLSLFFKSSNIDVILELKTNFHGVNFTELSLEENKQTQTLLNGNYEMLFEEGYKFIPDEVLKSISFNMSNIDEDILSNMEYELYSYLLYSFNSDEFKENRQILLNKFIGLYDLYGDNFIMNEKIFKQYHGFKFITCITFFYLIDFIKITSISTTIIDNITGEELHEYGIQIQEDFKDMLVKEVKIRNTILDKIFDDKCKKVTIKKKNGELHMLESQLEFDKDITTYVELERKYENADITGTTYKGKTAKYLVNEKIKLKTK